MNKKNIKNSKNIIRNIVSIVGVVSLLLAAIPVLPAQAAQITARKLTLSSSVPNTPATYTFNFTPAAATVIKSVNIDICTTASGACTPAGTGVPAGLTTTGAAVGTITGIGSGGSWAGTFTTNGRLRIANNSNTGAPSPIILPFTTITNPTATNTSFYARVTTYSDAAWTTPIDTGTVAASTATQIDVSATVDETLTFCTGTSGITSSSCSGATGSSVNLGTLTPSTTGTGTSQIGISTNAGTGYAIAVNGTNLSSGANNITALASQTASVQGTTQFGINLRDNATPNVGADPAGAGTTVPQANYNTADMYRFIPGGTNIVTAATQDDFRLFTVSYIANVSSTVPTGAYTTNMVYVATATF